MDHLTPLSSSPRENGMFRQEGNQPNGASSNVASGYSEISERGNQEMEIFGSVGVQYVWIRPSTS